MRMVICSIIGFGAGLWISISFIYPNDILNLALNTITIGDILRICAGTSVIGIVGMIGSTNWHYNVANALEFIAS